MTIVGNYPNRDWGRWKPFSAIATLSTLTSFCLLTFPAACLAVDPNRPLKEFRITHWTQKDGLLQDTVDSLAQNPDGFLWIASDEGLVRFDGTEFLVPDEFQKASPRKLIYSMAVDPAGQLWMGLEGGVYCRTRRGSLEYYGAEAGLPHVLFWAIASDPEGTVWVGTVGAGLFRRAGDRFIEFAPGLDLHRQSIWAICPGKFDDLWVGTLGGLYRINPSTGGAQRITSRNGLLNKAVTALAIDSRGRLWIGSSDGLAYLDHDLACPVDLPIGHQGQVTGLFVDSHGMLWVGTANGDICRISPDGKGTPAGALSISSITSGRRNALVRAFCEDKEGDIWVGSQGGLFRISDTRFTVCSSKQGLPSDLVNSVLASRSGKVWIGTDAGLAFLSEPATTRATLAPANPPILSEQITALCEDSRNILWVGTLNGSLQQFHQEPFSAESELSRFAFAKPITAICEVPPDNVWVGTSGAGLHWFHNGRLLRSFTEKDGIANDIINTLALGPDHTLWVAPAHGLLKNKDGELEDAISRASPVHDRTFVSLLVDSEGTVWAGTSGDGLARIKNGQAGGLCTTADGLFSDEFFTLLQDDKGNLWASSNRGIFATPSSDLNAFFDKKRSQVSCRVFTAADGLLTPECTAGGANTSCRSGDGRLWFATLGGAAATSGEALSTDSRSPPVVLEKVIANLNQSIPINSEQSPISLSSDTHSIEIHYAGLGLAAPESLQYRYQLDGFDPAWIEAGARRTAYYTNLPAGNYQFRVIARNRDGVWTPDNLATRLHLIVLPHFYQTWWFYVLCGAVVCLLIWSLYFWRLRQILQERARLARDLHDSLAQGLHGILWQTERAINSKRKDGPTDTIQILGRIKTLAHETLLEAHGALHAFQLGILAESDSLANALEKVVKNGVAATQLQAAVRVRGQPFRIRSQWEQALVRITQEALTNTLKHAQAHRFELEVCFEKDSLVLRLQDDGIGFSQLPSALQPVSTTSSGLGILGMKERSNRLGGEFSIESQPGKGTSIRVIAPASARVN